MERRKCQHNQILQPMKWQGQPQGGTKSSGEALDQANLVPAFMQYHVRPSFKSSVSLQIPRSYLIKHDINLFNGSCGQISQ